MGPNDSVGRLFVAVPLSDEVRHGLAAHLSDALDGPMPGRAVPADNWHLTLRFLGKTLQKELEVLLHRLQSGMEIAPFTLGFAGLGAFPRPSRATVLWLAIDQGADELAVVAALVEDAAVDAGFMPEERPFHAHLTLSRIRPHQDVTDAVKSVERFPLTQMVEEVVVYRSHLGGSKPARYEVLERVVMGGVGGGKPPL